jgi:hypothetical protein
MIKETPEVSLMDRLNNMGRKLLIQSATFLTVCFSQYSIAGVSGDGYWVIESGDSVYSIARNVFPDDAKKRSQFRKQLIENNTAVFKGNPGRINVGDRLALPAFAISKPVKVEEKVEPVQAEVIPPPVAAEEKPVVTPDPEEVIGHVVVSVGKMQASNRGSFRDLLRNSKVFKGDTIKTAANSYTQLRMKDGALLSLRPNTELVITDYNFDGKEDGTEKSFMELVRGGFRTITGYIGHKNKHNYRVRTSVATIGIRGTHYGLMICADGSCSNEAEPLEDGVYGGVVDGSINVSNDSGDYTFNNDQFFHVASATSAATELLVPPPVFHGNNDRVYAEKEKNSKPEQAEIHHDSDRGTKREIKAALSGKAKALPGKLGGKKGHGNRLGTLVKSYIENKPQPLVLQDQVNDAVKDIPAFAPAPEGSAVLLGLHGTDIINGGPDFIAASVIASPVTRGEIILGSKLSPEGFIIKNIPVAIRDVSNGKVHEVFLPSATAGVDFIAGDPIGVNWGRWTGGNYVLTENGTKIPTQGDLHYIYSDKITSPDQIAALGGLISTATYTLAGNTTPTDPTGNALMLGSLTMTTDFKAQAVTNYNVVVNNVNGTPAFNMINAAQTVPFLKPDINGNSMGEFDLISNPIANGGCTSCTGRASAAFVGNQAQGVITTYSMGDAANQAIGASGAAVLIRP